MLKQIKLVIFQLISISVAMAQQVVPYPMVLENTTIYNGGVKNYCSQSEIISPGDETKPFLVKNGATVDMLAKSEVHLQPGFKSTFLNGSNSSYLHIGNQTCNNDLIIISPDPSTSIINNVVHVNKWEKLEIGIELPYAYKAAIENFFTNYYANSNNPDFDLNPYAGDSLVLEMNLTRPDGTTKKQFGFFMRIGKWTNTTASFSGNGATIDDDVLAIEDDTDNHLIPYTIRFRVAPDMDSNIPWRFSITIKAPHTKIQPSGNYLNDLIYEGYSFICDPPLPDNKGYLQVNTANNRYLKFDNGEPFWGIGHNINNDRKWFEGNPSNITFSYIQKFEHDLIKQSFADIHNSGGNWARIGMFKLGYDFEHNHLGVYDKYLAPNYCCPEGATPYTCSSGPISGQTFTNNSNLVNTYSNLSGNRQAHAWALDDIVDEARKQNIYIQLCIDFTHVGADYQTFQWGDQCYYNTFVKPTFDPDASGTGKINVKKYFNDGTPKGSLYYWKRHYKYIMARWGYSTNIAEFELFNEIDGTLTWNKLEDWDLLDTDPLKQMCAYLKCAQFFNADPNLKSSINSFISDIVPYSKDVLDQPNRIFSLSYMQGPFLTTTWSNPTYTDVTDYYSLFANPNIDVCDIHIYSNDSWSPQVPEHQQDINDFRSTIINHFTTPGNPPDATYDFNGGITKPFHIGEGSGFMKQVDVSNSGTPFNVNVSTLFDNYELDMHNNIWSSAFMGCMSNTMTWQWEVVGWWPRGTPVPKAETGINFNPTNDLDQPNDILPVNNYSGLKFPITNHKMIHNYKPLADFLSYPISIISSGDYLPSKTYNLNGIESYYLVDNSSDHYFAFGWTHTVEKYWKNSYYGISDPNLENYFGCYFSPNTPSNQFTLSGFDPGGVYDVTYYHTHLDNNTLPTCPQIIADPSGNLTIQINTTNLTCDTVSTDYAFAIAKQGAPIAPQRLALKENKMESGFDFLIVPNPSNNVFVIQPLIDVKPTSVKLVNSVGQTIINRKIEETEFLKFDFTVYPKGVYAVIVYTVANVKSHLIVIQ